MTDAYKLGMWQALYTVKLAVNAGAIRNPGLRAQARSPVSGLQQQPTLPNPGANPQTTATPATSVNQPTMGRAPAQAMSKKPITNPLATPKAVPAAQPQAPTPSLAQTQQRPVRPLSGATPTTTTPAPTGTAPIEPAQKPLAPTNDPVKPQVKAPNLDASGDVGDVLARTNTSPTGPAPAQAASKASPITPPPVKPSGSVKPGSSVSDVAAGTSGSPI